MCVNSGVAPLNPDTLDSYGYPLFGDTDVPQCGWLSPDGLFAPCSPWEHGIVAWECILASGTQVSGVPYRDSHEYLLSQGWVKIHRRDRGDRSRTGGRFLFTAGTGVHTRTPQQEEVEAAWMALGAVEV